MSYGGFDWTAFVPALLIFLASYFGTKHGSKGGGS